MGRVAVCLDSPRRACQAARPQTSPTPPTPNHTPNPHAPHTHPQVGPAGRPLVALPSKTVRLVTVDLTPEDRAKYDA